MSDRYLVVIEGDEQTNFSSYSPDVPGVVATGKSRQECEREMQAAITFHIEGLLKAGDPIPAPNSTGAYVEVG